MWNPLKCEYKFVNSDVKRNNFSVLNTGKSK